MTMTPLRPNSAIAIDGGGIKGLVVARALTALETELGGGPLIKQPAIKLLTGTSTGAIITAMIAVGMTADQIVTKYRSLGQKVFPPVVPTWLPKALQTFFHDVLEVVKTSLYSNEEMITIARGFIGDMTGNPDLTMAQLHDRLGPHKSLILTTVNIIERRTQFIKSYTGEFGDWKLWEAIIASASAPIALPVFVKTSAAGKKCYYTDGGAGSFGNPAYIAARESISFQGFNPNEITIMSFGTGWVKDAGFAKSVGQPDQWHALNWAMNAPLLLIGDVERNQSLDIIQDFIDVDGKGLDFRRYQFPLETDIESDAFADNTVYDFMMSLGDKLGAQLRNNQFAPNADPQIDPERLYEGWQQRLVATARIK